MLTLVFASFLAATPNHAGNVTATLQQQTRTFTLVADDPKNSSQDSSDQTFNPKDSHRI
ncbi:MAG: hypothetical protein P4L36_18325 [Holophaga sp.]|nr:hypothetical protein [Holophaga sp.]